MNTPINATLPGQPHIAFLGEQLHVEGVRLSELAREHGTPLFVYSKAAMLSALAAYQRGFAGRQAQICYAMKANSSLAILQVFADAGCGFDIVSGGELARVLAAGGDPAKVIFSGVGKSRAEMIADRLAPAEAMAKPEGRGQILTQRGQRRLIEHVVDGRGNIHALNRPSVVSAR